MIRYIQMAALLTFGVVCIALVLAGCTPTVVDTACQSFGPITFSAKSDTPETVRQVRSHNAAWQAICQ